MCGVCVCTLDPVALTQNMCTHVSGSVMLVVCCDVMCCRGSLHKWLCFDRK